MKIKELFTKKQLALPMGLFILGLVVFSGASINQLYLNKKVPSKISDQINNLQENQEQAAGVQEDHALDTNLVREYTNTTKTSTSTSVPTTESNDNNSDSNSGNDNTPTISPSYNNNLTTTPTLTPNSTNTPTPTTQPTATLTPTPSNLTANLGVQRNDKGEIISAGVTANKPSTFVWKLSINDGNETEISPNPEISSEYSSSGNFDIDGYEQCALRGIICEIKLVVYVTSGSETIRLSS